MQSVSVMDLDLTKTSNQLRQLNFSARSETSLQDRTHAGNSGPNLIQFSGATELGSMDQETKYVLNTVHALLLIIIIIIITDIYHAPSQESPGCLHYNTNYAHTHAHTHTHTHT